MKELALGLIRVYQNTISRATPSSCRYLPSCSQYGYEAIKKFGLLKGGVLTVMRLCRCHPLSGGGYDPVP
ncbi:MAG: putative rane protein insertion efficiency factor 2 [Dehalococcoidia bacterium]|nr:putative rane protein insertion efficiency factor 2 [Dehalococcoidia bacterium]